MQADVLIVFPCSHQPDTLCNSVKNPQHISCIHKQNDIFIKITQWNWPELNNFTKEILPMSILAPCGNNIENWRKFKLYGFRILNANKDRLAIKHLKILVVFTYK